MASRTDRTLEGRTSQHNRTIRVLAQPEFPNESSGLGHAKRSGAFASARQVEPPLAAKMLGGLALNRPEQCSMCCLSCAVCGVRCAVCGVRCAVCGVRCAVCGVRCADLIGCACACCDSQENLPKRAKPGWCPSGQKPPRQLFRGAASGKARLSLGPTDFPSQQALRSDQTQLTQIT